MECVIVGECVCECVCNNMNKACYQPALLHPSGSEGQTATGPLRRRSVDEQNTNAHQGGGRRREGVERASVEMKKEKSAGRRAQIESQPGQKHREEEKERERQRANCHWKCDLWTGDSQEHFTMT